MSMQINHISSVPGHMWLVATILGSSAVNTQVPSSQAGDEECMGIAREGFTGQTYKWHRSLLSTFH